MELGRYRVIRKLGEGGNAQVLLAAASTGTPVVLKVPFSSNPDFAERLRDEARVGLRLNHPTIVETLDLFEHEGRPILVVEYVDGPDLAQLRRHLGPLPPALVARIARQVAEGLEAIHSATDEHGTPLNILHRDVAPGNILLTPEGNAKLIDLGIARGLETKSRRTQIGAVRGTMRYLAPELLEGVKHSASTDLWALGVTLFESSLGRRAVEGDERMILAAIVRGDITTLRPGEQINPRLDAGLRALLAPAEHRLRRALAAANIFRRIEEQLGQPPEVVLERIRALARDLTEESKKTPTPIYIEPAGPSIADAPAPITMETSVAGDDLAPLEATGDEFSVTRPAGLPDVTARPTKQLPAVSVPADAFREDQQRPVAEQLNSDPEAPTIQMAAYSSDYDLRHTPSPAEDPKALPALADEDEDDEAQATIAEEGPPAAMTLPTRADTVRDLELPPAVRALHQSAAPPASPVSGELPVTDPQRPSAREPSGGASYPATAPFVTEPVPAPTDDDPAYDLPHEVPGQPSGATEGPHTMRFAVPRVPEPNLGPRPPAPAPRSTQMLPTPSVNSPGAQTPTLPAAIDPGGFPEVGPATMQMPIPGPAGQGAAAPAPPPPPASPPHPPAPEGPSTMMLPTPGPAGTPAPPPPPVPDWAREGGGSPPEPQPTAPEPEPPAPTAAPPVPSGPIIKPPTAPTPARPSPPPQAPDSPAEATERVRRASSKDEPLSTSELAFKKSSSVPLVVASVIVFTLCLAVFLAFFFGLFDGLLNVTTEKGAPQDALEVVESAPGDVADVEE